MARLVSVPEKTGQAAVLLEMTGLNGVLDSKLLKKGPQSEMT